MLDKVRKEIHTKYKMWKSLTVSAYDLHRSTVFSGKYMEIEKKVDVVLLKGDDNNNHRSLNGISLQNGKGGNGNNNSCPDARRRMMKEGEE